MLLANVFCADRALAFGKTREPGDGRGTRPDVSFPTGFSGNRPRTRSSPTGSPGDAGTLVALYEHSVFTQGASGTSTLRSVGVELGKVLAQRIIPSSRASGAALARQLDEQLIRRYRRERTR
jgi:glucose-6-phosphate isomerase